MTDIKVFVTELGSYYGEANEHVCSGLAELILLSRPFLLGSLQTTFRVHAAAGLVLRVASRCIASYVDFICQV